MTKGAKVRSPGAGRARTPRAVVLHLVMTALVLLSLTLTPRLHAHHHDEPPHPQQAVMTETAPSDVEREGTVLHALFGHSGAAHGGVQGAALPESTTLASVAEASRLNWPNQQDHRLISQAAAPLLRPPRA